MKFALLLLGVQAVRIDQSTDSKGIWGDAMGGIDASSYNQADSSLDAYKGVEAPKIDYEAIARKKIEAEMKVKQKLV